MRATLSVPYLGTAAQRAKQERSDEVITIQLPLIEAEVENNPFDHADSCHVTVDWKDTTLDTRMLDDGVLTLYMWNAPDIGERNPTVDDVVFIGHVRNPERTLEVDEHGTLRIECIDYTGLFLEAKPFGSSGIPDYSQTLREAWRRICSQTPGSGILADSLVGLNGVDLDEKLGKAVAARFAKLAKVPTHPDPDTDAWSVWQQCVGMLGAVSWIEQDVCIVASSTNLYTERDPPVFTWGSNVSKLSESRQNVDIKGGVGLASFDPATGKVIEVFYPPIGDPRAQRKLTKAAKKHAPPLALSSERDKRHLFTLWGLTEESQLETVAKRVWEQISRQELSGKLTTPEMFVETDLLRQFNLLKLRAGDDIRVAFDQGMRQHLVELPTQGARVRYLTNRGYASDVALFLARNVEAFTKLDSIFYVDSVRKYMRYDNDGGEFRVDVSFINKIEVSEGAVA
jgi:hypothetical protein